MKWNETIVKIKESLLHALFPERIKCIFCGRDINHFEEQPYCEDCAKLPIFNDGPRCKFCDMQIKNGNTVCDFCGKKHKAFEQTFCPLLYQDYARRSILTFKSDNGRYLAYPFAKLILARISESKVSIDIIIPIPTHEKTKKQRGYNQADILAEEIGKLLDKPVRNDLIQKVKQTQAQKTLAYRERLKNVIDCFTLTDKDAVKDKNILLVDDVMTTGATLNAAAKLLKGVASHIYVAAIARDVLK